MWDLDYKESWILKNLCFWTVVLEKTLESPLDCKEIQPVHPKENQPWVFIWMTDVEAESLTLWPPDAKSWLISKDADAGKDWGQEEKGTIEDEMVGWHHQLNGHGFGWTLGVGDGQAWPAVVHGVTKSWTRLSNWTKLTHVSKDGRLESDYFLIDNLALFPKVLGTGVIYENKYSIAEQEEMANFSLFLLKK